MTFSVNMDTSKFDQFDFGFELVDSPIPVASETPAASVTSSELEGKFDVLEGKLNAVISIVSTIEDTLEDTNQSDSLSQFNKMNEKLDKILSLETQDLLNAMQGQSESIRAVIDEVEERKMQLHEEYNIKIKQVEDLVLPLLFNLTKNPEREYIKWPNRVESIQTQINKILEVTRGDGD